MRRTTAASDVPSNYRWAYPWAYPWAYRWAYLMADPMEPFALALVGRHDEDLYCGDHRRPWIWRAV